MGGGYRPDLDAERRYREQHAQGQGSEPAGDPSLSPVAVTLALVLCTLFILALIP